MARIDIGAGQTPTSGNDLVFGTAGNDTITDPGGNDLTFAGAGHDRITPGTGLDGVDGGAGTDTVVLSGNSGDYRIGSGTRNGITGVLVDDLRRGAANADGLDAYVRVERLEFADGVRLLVPDQAPDAVDDAAQTDEDTVMTINVLANDTDPDGDALSIASLSDADATKPGNQTALGATISVVDGQVRYDPSASDTLRALNTGQSAADSFSYTVYDGFGGRDTAAVGVTVNGLSQNQPPDAVDDFATTIESAPIPIAVLRNDTDPDGDALVHPRPVGRRRRAQRLPDRPRRHGQCRGRAGPLRPDRLGGAPGAQHRGARRRQLHLHGVGRLRRPGHRRGARHGQRHDPSPRRGGRFRGDRSARRDLHSRARQRHRLRRRRAGHLHPLGRRPRARRLPDRPWRHGQRRGSGRSSTTRPVRRRFRRSCSGSAPPTASPTRCRTVSASTPPRCASRSAA